MGFRDEGGLLSPFDPLGKGGTLRPYNFFLIRNDAPGNDDIQHDYHRIGNEI